MHIRRWATMHMEGDEREQFLRQVWRPTIEVSIVLINLPRLEVGSLASVFPNESSSTVGCGNDLHGDYPPLFPADALPFPALECGASNDTSSYHMMVPLMMRCDAVMLLQDKTFSSRLEGKLREYEEACRLRLVGEWPDRSLFASIEHLVRLLPERSPQCTSLILLSNANPWSNDSVSLLESSVRRKNIILSILFLSEATSHDFHTSPLSQFLSTVGGFGVHLDHWLSLASPRLNIDWCRRFGGPRCLAQQLFVQMEAKFPVRFNRISQNMPTTSVERACDPCILYNTDSGLSDFALRRVGDVISTLRCVAEARFNQGWSVVMNQDVENHHVAQLHARYQHHLRRGKIIISYEMEISYPVVYRCVTVSGTKVLVDQFVKAKGEDRAVIGTMTEAKTGWLTYLIILRSQLHSWMRAEQAALQCLLAAEHPRSSLLEELQWLSSREGVSAGWSSHCSVRSVGLFFRWEGGVLQLLDPCNKIQSTSVPSVAALGVRVLQAALGKRHRTLGREESDTFVSVDNEGACPRYVVQVFLLDDAFASGHEGFLAAGLECRFSFLLSSIDEEVRIISEIIAGVQEAVSASKKVIVGGKTELRLVVEVNVDATNERALHLTSSNVSPRRLDLLAMYSEPSPSSFRTTLSGVTNRKAVLLYPLLKVPPGKRIRTVQQLTFRCFLTPYLVNPWVLSDALVFHWAIGASEMWRTFAKPAFNFFLTRRIRDGFRLLHCLTQRKAILHATRLCDGHHVVDVFDVIEAPLENGDVGLTAQVIIYRYVRPFEFALSSSYRQQLTADISEDIRVATVLHTFSVLSSVALPTSPQHSLPTKEGKRGLVQLAPRLESLLPFLSASHAHPITLHSLPSMGEEGEDDLRETIGRFVSSLGDRSATVSANAVDESLLRKLYGTDEGVDTTIEKMRDSQLFFSMLMPLQCSCATFLLMPRVSKGAISEKMRGVTLHVLSMDTSALYKGVMRLYSRPGTEEMDDDGSPNCSHTSLLEALTKLLTSFSSLYQAWRLLEEQRYGVGRQTAETAGMAQDVLRVFATFQDYRKEVDVSHLLYVQECKLRNRDHGPSLPASLRSLITSLVRSMCLRPLPTHPTVFLPVNDRSHSSVEEPAGESAAETTSIVSSPGHVSQQDLTTLPFLVKIALLFVSEDGHEEDCMWIYLPENVTVDTPEERLPFWSPAAAELQPRASGRRLVMRFFVMTAPKHLVDLSRDNYNPPVEVIRRILGELLRECQGNCEEGKGKQSLFFSTESSVAGVSALSRQALPFDELPAAVQRFFDVLVFDLTKSVARHCLSDCLQAVPFRVLRHLVKGDETDNTCVACPANSKTNEDLEEAEDLQVLAQKSPEVLHAASGITGLMELLAFAVSPALLSVPCFEADSFAVEFTQQSKCSYAVDPTHALLHVFTRCLAEDLVCVVPATSSCFLFVPNKDHFDSGWLLLHVTAEKSSTSQRVCLLFNEHQGDSSVCLYLCKHLRRSIEAKVREVSQLHLLKQLRDTQNANNELIPPLWGDQFSSPQPASRTKKESIAPPPAAFYCRGTTVLKIPIYYKLQHQCKKILSRIASNGPRLELINIYNREQCFVVADDIQRDTFHYIRLVFVKDTAHPPLLTAPSPSLSPADRCPLLIVQLFSATKNALVERPLRKLQDFCFLLAIQELQSHLNYVQHKCISAVDLMFLQHQRLDHVCIDLQEVVGGSSEPLHPTYVHLAFALVVLGLKENKFKYFHVQEGGNPTISHFMEHYGLLDEDERDSTESFPIGESCPHDTSSSSSCSSSLVPATRLRFVKVIEGLTEVLVSCVLRVTDGSRVVVDRFLTKVPEERYTIGESETIYLTQIDEVVRDAVLQWQFFVMSKRFSSLPCHQVVPAVTELLRYGSCVTSTESSTLRFKNFSLERVAEAVFPFLVERLTGIFEPFSPVCFECRPGTGPSHLAGFPWRWVEKLQGDPQVEHVEFYLTCGYCITVDASKAGLNDEEKRKDAGAAAATATRALRVTHPDLPITKITVLTQSPLLREHGIEVQISTEPHVVMHISLLSGVTAALFNMRDSDILLRLMGHIIAEAEQQSNLLHDVMIQQMGFGAPSYLTEPVLARFCCGDDSNVTQGKHLDIHEETYRRRVNYVRFPLQTSASGDPFTIIVEGLFNRGLIVNGVLVVDDAVRVLYNECPQYSLKECQRIMQNLLCEGVFRMEHNTGRCRVVNSNDIPDDALIGCSFRRHMQVAHILVESKNSRSGVAEFLQRCESLWNSSSRENYVHLAKSVVFLQRRSKQIFGSRVPDFTLLRRTRWRPSDDILDPSLPPRNQPGSEYCPSVDAALQSYVQHLRQTFPSARIIDLDASNAAISSDAALLHRLRCRYGKVVSPEGKEIRFIPHLYYALIPVIDVLNSMGWRDPEHTSTTSLTDGGLFIVEIGFQVAHFALDVFMVKGVLISTSTAAQAAAWFKQVLKFNSVLYDLTVSRLSRCVQMYATFLPGHRQTSDALENLVKYYPHPPYESLNIAAVFDVDETYLRRMRKLLTAKQNEGPDGSGVRLLIPDQGEVLLREASRERYHYCGLVVWSSLRLFVLLSTLRDTTGCDRCLSGDLRSLALRAKDLLLQLLMDSTLQQRVNSAWERFRTPFTENGENVGVADWGPATHDLQTLKTRCIRIPLTTLVEPFQQLRLDWRRVLEGQYRSISTACMPKYALHLITDDSSDHEGEDSNQTTGTVALTLTMCKSTRVCFVVVEFYCGKYGAIKSAAFNRGMSERDSTARLQEEAEAEEEEEEAELAEQMLKVLSSVLWGAVGH
ncbi:hypothetical protein DQ04_06361020 [Trypanosoma grayi]|uniref:hypothetical protein n=1 Tax=Trypanosoma grayi TaxID=71804 RepID=UPI0004F45690|nr:hypothetical protein DQ04_06361020 [Trypanosoma grayi]KEG08832.1 hypothetical protein DQ04_06361020 [Trypanosoma grayi]